MKALLVAVAVLAPLSVWAQDEAPPPPPPPLPAEPYYPGYVNPNVDQHNTTDGNVRVRLKTEVRGVHLVEEGNQRKMCWKNCDREFRVYSYGRYQLVDEDLRSIVGDIVFPTTATRLVLDYRGRITGLMVPGIVAIAMGGAAIVIGLAVLAFAGLALLLGGSSVAGTYALYSLPFVGGGAVLLTGGLIMAIIGGKQRYEITPDVEAGLPPPAPVGDVPPPPPNPEPVPAIP